MKKIITLILFFNVVIAATAQLTYHELKVEYDSVWTFKKLQIIPIKFKPENNLQQSNATVPAEIISLKEAMHSGKIVVKEVLFNHGADVNVLVIKNNSKQHVLIIDGELISGGKQDRIVAETILIPPGKEENYVAVFCAEKGRWDNKAKAFVYEGMADAGLRKKVDILHRQTEVWKEIEQQFSANNKKAETWPYIQLHKQMQAEDSAYLQYFIDQYKLTDSSFAGFAAVTGNRIIGCEVFASLTYTQHFFKEIIIGYIHSLTKTDEAPSVTRKDCEHFFDELFANESSQKQFLATHGKADKFNGKVIHLIAYGE